MSRNLIYPQLLGRMIQKVEEGGNGTVYIHTKAFVLEIGADNASVSGISHALLAREGKPEPLVIPAKKA